MYLAILESTEFNDITNFFCNDKSCTENCVDLHKFMFLPSGATGLSAACECGILWSYSFIIFDKNYRILAHCALTELHAQSNSQTY